MDREKQKLAEKAANLFLGGLSMEKVSLKVGLGSYHIYDIFRRAAGDTWLIDFKRKMFPHRAAQYRLMVPRLLSEETEEAIRKRCDANETCMHSIPRVKYPFGRMIFLTIADMR